MNGTLALAEAIRLGSKERPQVREVLFGYADRFGEAVAIPHADCHCYSCELAERSIVKLGSCALGAAIEAIGGEVSPENEGTQELSDAFPCIEEHIVDFTWCDRCGSRIKLESDYALKYNDMTQSQRLLDCVSNTLRNAIVCANDHQRWTREQIADWVGSL